MTREEKINTLKAIIQECEEYQWQRKETLFEIIKDLEQEPILDEIRAEIEQRPYGVANDSVIHSIKIQGIKYERAANLEILDKYKAEMEDKE